MTGHGSWVLNKAVFFLIGVNIHQPFTPVHSKDDAVRITPVVPWPHVERDVDWGRDSLPSSVDLLEGKDLALCLAWH
jgi:hypothetical protein